MAALRAALGASTCGPAGPRLRPLPPLRGRARTSPACGLPILGPAAAASRCAITRWPEHFPPPPRGAALESPRPGPTLARLLLACPCSVTIRCRHFCKAVFYAVESPKPPICRRLANRRSPPARRLRPAGLRPASRRLSRRPSAPERTVAVLPEPKGGKNARSFRSRWPGSASKAGRPSRRPSLFSFGRDRKSRQCSGALFSRLKSRSYVFQDALAIRLPRSQSRVVCLAVTTNI